MKSQLRGAVGLLAAVFLFVCVPAIARGAPPNVRPQAALPGNFSAASISAPALPTSPFYVDLNGLEGGDYRAYEVYLNPGWQLSVRLAATQGNVHAGLLPPSAPDVYADFVAWDDADFNLGYVRFSTASPGLYTLLIYCDDEYPAGATTRCYVEWTESLTTPKSNIPGVALPPGGVSGSLDSMSNWLEVHRVTMAAGEGLHVRLDPGAGDADVDLDVYSPNWTDVYSAPGSSVEQWRWWSRHSAGFAEQLYDRMPTTGDYYLVASMWRGPSPAPYHLDYLITDPTAVTARPSASALQYGQKLTVAGLLTEDDDPLGEQTVNLEAYQSGAWHYVTDSQTTTATTYPGPVPAWWTLNEPFASGTYLFTLYPTTNVRLHTWYYGVFWAHTPAFSPTVDVLVSAYLPTPGSSSSVKRGKSFKVTGFVRPRHSTGSACPILLKIERRQPNGSYVLYKSVRTKGSNYKDYTKYVGSLSITKAGTYRVRAYHPGNPVTATDGNASTYSGYRSFKVK